MDQGAISPEIMIEVLELMMKNPNGQYVGYFYFANNIFLWKWDQWS